MKRTIARKRMKRSQTKSGLSKGVSKTQKRHNSYNRFHNYYTEKSINELIDNFKKTNHVHNIDELDKETIMSNIIYHCMSIIKARFLEPEGIKMIEEEKEKVKEGLVVIEVKNLHSLLKTANGDIEFIYKKPDDYHTKLDNLTDFENKILVIINVFPVFKKNNPISITQRRIHLDLTE